MIKESHLHMVKLRSTHSIEMVTAMCLPSQILMRPSDKSLMSLLRWQVHFIAQRRLILIIIILTIDTGKPIPGFLCRVLTPDTVLLALNDRAPQLTVSENR